MKLKEREKGKISHYLKNTFRLLCKLIFNKKMGVLFLILGVIFLLFIGMGFGLLISGYFGTFDDPSQNAIDLLHSFGISGLQGLKLKIENVMKENVKIPVNYIKGKLSNPEIIYIDIGFTDFQKIEYNRQNALESLEFKDPFQPFNGVLMSYSNDFVPARIRYQDKELSVRLRLKGDYTDHLEGDKWSFRVKIKNDDVLFGMKTFSIQDPKTRSYLNEFIFHNALKKEGLLSINYDFIEVVINGENKGVFAIEEHFEGTLIERNNLREGVIIKFNEDHAFEDILSQRGSFSNVLELFEYSEEKSLEWFYESSIEPMDDKILEDPSLNIQFNTAKNLLESFRKRELKTSEVFDTDKLAKYFAVNTLVGSAHASRWNNIRFYYNPVTSKLEPIGYDAEGVDSAGDILKEYSPDCVYHKGSFDCMDEFGGFEELIFRDADFFKKYITELERVSNEKYLDEFFDELGEEIIKKKNIIYKDTPSYHFSKDKFYNNQKIIKSQLNPSKSLNAYFEKDLSTQDKIVLSVSNINSFPIEIKNIVYEDSALNLIGEGIIIQPSLEGDLEYHRIEFDNPSNFILNNEIISNFKLNYKILGTERILENPISSWSYIEEDFIEEDFIRQEVNVSQEMLIVDDINKVISFKQGDWILKEDLVIPEGYSFYILEGTNIDLLEESSILSYSDVQVRGSLENPIKLFSSDETGQGFIVLNANDESNLENVIISDMNAPIKPGWELTGAVTFYESPFTLTNVIIRDMKSEDSLNAINSKYKIEGVVFENCFSDCFDDDFSGGMIKSSSFLNCGNDCLDVSGAKTEVKEVLMKNIGDKGVSAGEKSNLIITNINVGGSNENYIGIASKDQSEIIIEDSQISNVKYAFAVYQKKSEYGPAEIIASNIVIDDAETDYIIERDSNFIIDDKIILGTKQGVYEILYGVEK